MHDGINRMGDMLMYASETIVSGHVQNAAGARLEGVTVRAGETPDFEINGWGNRNYLESVTSPQGEFTIAGHEDWSEFKAWAFYSNDVSSPSEAHEAPEGLESARSEVQTIQYGSGGVVLVLKSWAQPLVELLLPAGASVDAIELNLLPVADLAASNLPSSHSSDSTSNAVRCEFDPLEPGAYDLRCSLKREDKTLVELKDLQVAVGASTTQIDLRDRLFVHNIRLQGDQRASSGGVYCYREADSELDWAWESFVGAALQITTTFKSVDVRVFPKRFMAGTLEGLTGEADLSLRSAYRLRLVLRTDGVIPAAPFAFSLRVNRGKHELGAIVGPKAFRDDLRELLVDVPVAGKLNVTWYYAQLGDSFSIAGPVLAAQALEIEVRETTDEQRILLQLDGDVLTHLAQNSPWR